MQRNLEHSLSFTEVDLPKMLADVRPERKRLLPGRIVACHFFTCKRENA